MIIHLGCVSDGRRDPRWLVHCCIPRCISQLWEHSGRSEPFGEWMRNSGKSYEVPCTSQDTCVVGGRVDGRTLLVSSNFSGCSFSGFFAGSFPLAQCLIVFIYTQHIHFHVRRTYCLVTSPFSSLQLRTRDTWPLRLCNMSIPALGLVISKVPLDDSLHKHAVTRGSLCG